MAWARCWSADAEQHHSYTIMSRSKYDDPNAQVLTTLTVGTIAVHA